MQIKVDVSEALANLTKGLAKLSENKIKLSTYRAINSALGVTQTQSIREITKRYNLTYSQASERFFTVKASLQAPDRGYIKVYTRPIPLNQFGSPKEVKDGVGTTKSKGAYSSKKVKGLRSNGALIKSGVIIQVIRGEDKVLESAYLNFRKSTPQIKMRGKYDHGFNRNPEDGPKSLRGVGVGSAMREVRPILQAFINTNYKRILIAELQKRMKGIGEQHVKL